MNYPLQRQAEEPAVKPLSLQAVAAPRPAGVGLCPGVGTYCDRLSYRVRVSGECNLAQMVTVTSAPAWVYNVEGYRTQIRLTDTMGVRIAGGLEPGRVRLRVVADRGCEILSYRPPAWKSVAVKMDDISVPFREVEEAGRRFVVTTVALLGPHTIVVSQGG